MAGQSTDIHYPTGTSVSETERDSGPHHAEEVRGQLGLLSRTISNHSTERWMTPSSVNPSFKFRAHTTPRSFTEDSQPRRQLFTGKY